MWGRLKILARHAITYFIGKKCHFLVSLHSTQSLASDCNFLLRPGFPPRLFYSTYAVNTLIIRFKSSSSASGGNSNFASPLFFKTIGISLNVEGGNCRTTGGWLGGG